METLALVTDIRFLSEEASYRTALSLVSPERREKAERYRQFPDRCRSLCAELLLRRGLSLLGITELPEIGYGEAGKPYFPERPELFFNLSHSGDYVFCVISDAPVGCDIEKMKPYRGGIAERFFSPEENAVLEACSENEKSALFYRIWTKKESYLKMTGSGLTVPTDGFSVFSPESGICFYGYEEIPGYACAACIKGNTLPERLTYINLIPK